MNKTPERIKFLTDILITAVEGGIGYWSQIEGYNYSSEDPSKRGGLLYIADMETKDFAVPIVRSFDRSIVRWFDDDDLGEVFVVHLNLDTIAAGIWNIIRNKDFKINEEYRALIAAASRVNDSCPDEGTGDIDADVADVIVQAGIFNQIIFG